MAVLLDSHSGPASLELEGKVRAFFVFLRLLLRRSRFMDDNLRDDI